MQWTRNSDTSQKTRQKIPKGTQAALSCANRPTPPLIFQWHQSTLQSSGLWSKPHVKSITVTDHKNSHNHQTLGTQETWIDWLSNCWVANWLLLAIYPLWYPGIESDWFEISFFLHITSAQIQTWNKHAQHSENQVRPSNTLDLLLLFHQRRLGGLVGIWNQPRWDNRRACWAGRWQRIHVEVAVKDSANAKRSCTWLDGGNMSKVGQPQRLLELRSALVELGEDKPLGL